MDSTASITFSASPQRNSSQNPGTCIGFVPHWPVREVQELCLGRTVIHGPEDRSAQLATDDNPSLLDGPVFPIRIFGGTEFIRERTGLLFYDPAKELECTFFGGQVRLLSMIQSSMVAMTPMWSSMRPSRWRSHNLHQRWRLEKECGPLKAACSKYHPPPKGGTIGVIDPLTLC